MLFWVLYGTAMVGMLAVPKAWVLWLRSRGTYARWRDVYARWLVALHADYLVTLRPSFFPRLLEAVVFNTQWFLFATWFRATELVGRRDVFYPLFAYVRRGSIVLRYFVHLRTRR